MTRPGERVGVAVSGGADSVALLLVLVELSKRLGIELGVVHLNHGLRGAQSDADERFVRELAERLELPFHARRAALDESRNLEAAGRQARYAFFEELIADRTFDRIATGHTRSDQAETVLFRLMRGAGTAGLAGILPTREPGIIRPLIEIERAEIVRWLRERGAAWREDASNLDTRFARNRIRHELLPRLRRDWNPRIDAALARHAARAAADEDYWRGEVERRLGELVVRRSEGAVTIDCDRAAALHPALLARVLRRAALEAGAAADGLGADRLAELAELATSPGGDGGLEFAGLSARRSFGWLRLSGSPGRGPAAIPTVLEPPTSAAVPDFSAHVTVRLADAKVYNEAVRQLIDWKLVPKPLVLRGWRPGDRLKRAPERGPEKLRSLFQQGRVAAWDRWSWPVIVAGEEGCERVIWTRAFGVDSDFTVKRSTDPALEVREITAEGREIRRIEDWFSGVYKK